MTLLRKSAWFGNAFERLAVPLLLLMAVWALIFPASYWVGWWPGYTERMAALASQPFQPSPRNVLTKYENYPDVKLFHQLPAGVWSICGVLQLTPRVRATAPRLHRISGRIMLACSALLMIGYGLMEFHGIVEPFEEQDHGTGAHGMLRGGPIGHTVMRAVALWFIATGWLAWQHARRRRYAAHSAWIVRHMAAGGWVIVQRVIEICIAITSEATQLEWSDARRRQQFYGASGVAMAVSFSGAEYFLRRVGREQHAAWLKAGAEPGEAAGTATTKVVATAGDAGGVAGKKFR